MDIPVADGSIRGYLAEPTRPVSGDPPWPGVVVVHDIVGLSEDTRNITDRIATAGYLALAPDLFSRGGFVRCIRSVFRSMTAAQGRSFEDIEAARRVLAGRADCTGKVGVVGFCMGGGFALVAATRGFDAAAPYYGPFPADLSILDGACPVVASFGRRDLGLRGAATTLETELTKRGIPHDVKEYPDAGHAFANQLHLGPLNLLVKVSGMGYHRESAEDAWRRVFAFFAEHLR
jgi:carboxymethylenebutenolidase